MSVNDSLLSFYGLGRHSTIFKEGDKVRLRPFPIKHQIPSLVEQRANGGTVTTIIDEHHNDGSHPQLIDIDGHTSSGFWWELDE